MLEQKDYEMITEIVAKSIEPLKRDIREVQLTLENEMLLIRVNKLENEMTRLKKGLNKQHKGMTREGGLATALCQKDYSQKYKSHAMANYHIRGII